MTVLRASMDATWPGRVGLVLGLVALLGCGRSTQPEGSSASNWLRCDALIDCSSDPHAVACVEGFCVDSANRQLLLPACPDGMCEGSDVDAAAAPPDSALRCGEDSGGDGGTDPCQPVDAPSPVPAGSVSSSAEQPDVALHGPAWMIDAGDEHELCYATYFDLGDDAPEDVRVPCPEAFGGPGQTCVALDQVSLRWLPSSHHMFISVYAGNATHDDPAWGGFACRGGTFDGMACDPTRAAVSATGGGADCGRDGVCATPRLHNPHCAAWGPEDRHAHSQILVRAESPSLRHALTPDVYAVAPIRGFVLWDVHSFNVSETPRSVEQRMEFTYAAPAQRRYPLQHILDQDEAFALAVPPFERREYCETHTLPQYARLIELSASIFRDSTEFRAWLPPQAPCDRVGDRCEVPEGEPALEILHAIDYPHYLDPPLALDSPNVADRTVRFCGVIDNGADDASRVKRQSDVSKAATGYPFGGSCDSGELTCIGGSRHGERCGGDTGECPGGGVCDACPLVGGVATYDERFILTGTYFVKPPE